MEDNFKSELLSLIESLKSATKACEKLVSAISEQGVTPFPAIKKCPICGEVPLFSDNKWTHDGERIVTLRCPNGCVAFSEIGLDIKLEHITNEWNNMCASTKKGD